MFSLNLLLVAIIIFTLVYYFYCKTKQFRSTLPIRKKWYQAKAGVALGLFIAVFGMNAIVIYEGTVISIIIAAFFLIIGLNVGLNQYKRVRHEQQFIKEEYELNK